MTILSAENELLSQANAWILDSGATCHVCNNEKMFIEFNPLKRAQSVILGDGHRLEATGRGVVDVQLILPNGQTKKKQICDVLYVPGFSYNLLSVAKLIDTGKRVTFYATQCEITDKKERLVAVALKKGGLYYLNCTTQSQSHAAHVVKKSVCTHTWHRRYGHLGKHYLQQLMKKDMVRGLSYHTVESTEVCEPCIEGKLHKTKFPTNRRKRAKKPLKIIHSDVCWKMRNLSLSGMQYFISFIDDCTHFTWVYAMQQKSEAFQKFKEWKLWLKESLIMVY